MEEERRKKFRTWFLRQWAEWDRAAGRRTTQHELAAHLGVGRSSIAQYVSGYKTPEGDNLRNISKVFGPEVYSVLGLPVPEDDPLAAYPPEVRGAVIEIRQLLSSTDPADWGDPDFTESVRMILAKYGAKDITIE